MIYEIKEEDFQQQVVDMAKLFGWMVHAERACRTKRGWRTPIQGHPGFPDLVLANPKTGGVIFVELKSETGRLSQAQERWLATLNADLALGIRVHVWRPRDMDQIEEILRREGE